MTDRGSQTMETQDHGWLIHKSGRGWYRPDAQGYTNDTAYAGRYPYKEAVRHSHPNGLNGPRDGMSIKHESELPHPQTADPIAALIEAQAAQIATLQAEVERLRGGSIPEPTCPNIDAAIAALEQVRSDNSQMRYGYWHMQLERDDALARAEAAEARKGEAG